MGLHKLVRRYVCHLQSLTRYPHCAGIGAIGHMLCGYQVYVGSIGDEHLICIAGVIVCYTGRSWEWSMCHREAASAWKWWSMESVLNIPAPLPLSWAISLGVWISMKPCKNKDSWNNWHTAGWSPQIQPLMIQMNILPQTRERLVFILALLHLLVAMSGVGRATVHCHLSPNEHDWWQSWYPK